MLFREVEDGEEGEEGLAPYDGHHVALYVNDFAALYSKLSQAGLIWQNPRFPQFDYSEVTNAGSSVLSRIGREGCCGQARAGREAAACLRSPSVVRRRR